MATVQQGDQAPDFELIDSTRQPVRLSDYRGKKAVVLVFFPFAFSRLCTSELCSIRDGIENFRNTMGEARDDGAYAEALRQVGAL